MSSGQPLVKYMVKEINSPSDFKIVRTDAKTHTVDASACRALTSSTNISIGMILGYKEFSEGSIRRVHVRGIVAGDVPQISVEDFDSGDLIGIVDAIKLYRIPSSEKQNPGCIRVSLHGIRPLALEITNQKLEVKLQQSLKWTLIAIRAFRGLVERAQDVSVEFVNEKQIRLGCLDSDSKWTDAGEYLCSKDFAVKIDEESSDSMSEGEMSVNDDEEEEVERKIFDVSLNDYVGRADFTESISIDVLLRQNPCGIRFKLASCSKSGINTLRSRTQSAVLSEMGLLLSRGFPNIHVYCRNEHQFFVEVSRFAFGQGCACFVCPSTEHCDRLSGWLRNEFEYRRKCYVVNSKTALDSHARVLRRSDFNLLVTIPSVAAETIQEWQIRYRLMVVFDTNSLLDEHSALAKSLFRAMNLHDQIAHDINASVSTSLRTPTTLVLHSSEYFPANEQKIVDLAFPSKAKLFKMRRELSAAEKRVNGPIVSLFGSMLSFELRKEAPVLRLKLFEEKNSIDKLLEHLSGGLADMKNGTIVICPSFRIKGLVSKVLQNRFGIRMRLSVYMIEELLFSERQALRNLGQGHRTWIVFDKPQDQSLGAHVDTILMLARKLDPSVIFVLLSESRSSYCDSLLTARSLLASADLHFSESVEESPDPFCCRHVALFGECISKLKCEDLLPMLGKSPIIDSWTDETREISVKIKSVISPNLIYALRNYHNYSSLDVDLQLAMKSPVKVCEIEQNQIYVYKDAVSSWKRVRVLSADKMFLIDCGVVRKLVSSDSLFVLPEQFRSIPPLVIECVVCGIRPVDDGQFNWPLPTCAAVHEFLYRKIVSLTVIASVQNDFGTTTVFASTVRESDANTDDGVALKGKTIREHLFEKKLAVDNYENHVNVIQQLFGLNKNYDLVDKTDDCSVLLTRAKVRIVGVDEGRRTVYLVENQRFKEFCEMNKNLRISGDITVALSDVRIGQLVLAKDDGKWKRCRVVADKCRDSDLRTIRLRPIDFGKEFTVETRTFKSFGGLIRLLNPNMAKLKPFKIQITVPVDAELKSVFIEPSKVMSTHVFQLTNEHGHEMIFDLGDDGLETVPNDFILTSLAFLNSAKTAEYLEKIYGCGKELREAIKNVDEGRFPRSHSELSIDSFCFLLESRCFVLDLLDNVFDSLVFDYMNAGEQNHSKLLKTTFRLTTALFAFNFSRKSIDYLIDFVVDCADFQVLINQTPDFTIAAWRCALRFDRLDLLELIPENACANKTVARAMEQFVVDPSLSEPIRNVHASKLARANVCSISENESNDEKSICSELSDDSSSREFSNSEDEETYLGRKFARDYLKVLREATKPARCEEIVDGEEKEINIEEEDDARIHGEDGTSLLPYPDVYWSQDQNELRLRIPLSVCPNARIEIDDDSNLSVRLLSSNQQNYGFRIGLHSPVFAEPRLYRMPSDFVIVIKKTENKVWPSLCKKCKKYRFVKYDLEKLENANESDDEDEQVKIAEEMINQAEKNLNDIIEQEMEKEKVGGESHDEYSERNALWDY